MNTPHDPSVRIAHPLRGILLFMLALFLFACLDTTTKFLANTHNVPLIVAIRYAVHFALILALLTPNQVQTPFRTQRTGLVILRAASLAVGSLFFTLALRTMPVAETTAVNFLAPLLVVLLAHPLLGERIGAWGWMACLLGFGGVLLIARPGGSLELTGVVYCIFAMLAGTVYQLLSRVLVRTESTMAMQFYTALVGTIGFGAALPWFWPSTMPTAFEWMLFVSTGVASGLGHYLFTAAYRHTSASLLAPMIYLQLIWAGLLGWVVFGHMPDELSILGMLVVAASGVMVALKSRSQPQTNS